MGVNIKRGNVIIRNTIIEGANIAVNMSSGISNKVIIEETTIIDSDTNSCGLHFYKPKLGSKIENTKFIGLYQALYAANGELDIENCYFGNVDSVETLCETTAIEFVSMSGSMKRNTIYGYSTGVLLYDSDPVIARNKIEECGNEGLWLINDSYPDLTDAGNGAYNWLECNGANHDTSTQVRIAGKVYPNMKNGQNNIWPASVGYAFTTTGIPPSTVSLKNNYWGSSSPIPTNLFNNWSTVLEIDPFLIAPVASPDGYRTLSVYDDMLNQALAAIAIDDYSTAIENLEDIVLEDTLDNNRIGAVSLLTDCWVKAENDIPMFITFLQGLADSTRNERIAHEVLHCKAQLNAELGNYEDAIDFYEGVILDPTSSFEDSICAIIDAGRIYLIQNGHFEQLSVPGGSLAEVTPTKSSDRQTEATGGYARDIQPHSYGEYLQRSHELISQLRHQTSSDVEEVALPKQFALHQNYPNPFNPATSLRFDLPQNAHVKMQVYNLLGQRVLTLLDKPMNAGYHQVMLDMSPFASGVYFYAIQAGEYSQVKKMVLLK